MTDGFLLNCPNLYFCFLTKDEGCPLLSLWNTLPTKPKGLQQFRENVSSCLFYGEIEAGDFWTPLFEPEKIQQKWFADSKEEEEDRDRPENNKGNVGRSRGIKNTHCIYPCVHELYSVYMEIST